MGIQLVHCSAMLLNPEASMSACQIQKDDAAHETLRGKRHRKIEQPRRSSLAQLISAKSLSKSANMAAP
jgi:hypothetical protein